MRIVFLCKRDYMSKDVIDDRYARLFEIPYELAKRGHQLDCFCLSYRKKNQGELFSKTFENGGSITFFSFNLGSLILPGLMKWKGKLKSYINKCAPDIIIGASDSIHCILARVLSNKTGVPYALDLYDNFESFGLTKIPGISPMYRKAVRQALWVSCVSDPLTEYVMTEYKPVGNVFTLESTITTSSFSKLDQSECRKQLSLPASGKMVGIAGALTQARGIDSLYKAFSLLQQKDVVDDVYLVLAGPVDKKHLPPKHNNIIYLGNLPHDQVNIFFNALDVAVIIVMDNAFGRYSFPQKAYEMIAAGVAIVATRIGAMTSLFSNHPQSLYESGNSEDLCQKLLEQLQHPDITDIQIETWTQKASCLEAVMESCLSE